MIDLTITITLYDLEIIQDMIKVLKKYSIQKPIFIIRYKKSYQITFESDYEHWELQKEISYLYEGYQFSENPGNGKQDIKLSIHRSQSSISSDDWGRRFNKDAINKTVYLIKSELIEDLAPSNTFYAILGDELKEYKVHIVQGKYRDSDKLFYRVVRSEFVNLTDIEFLSDRRLETIDDAFWEGYRHQSLAIEKEYNEKRTIKNSKRKKK